MVCKMKYSLYVLTVSLIIFIVCKQDVFAQQNDIPETKDQCMNCHSMLDGKFKAPASSYTSDVHFRKGLACSSCHGGDSKNEDQDKAMNKSAGFIGVPKGFQISKICAKCHSEKFTALQNSIHGESSTGKGSIINSCITCHGVHNIISVKSPSSKVNGANIVSTCAGCHSNAAYMKNYNPEISVDMLDKYKTSMHGKKVFGGDAKAANCASCHGSHDVKKVNNPQSNVYFSNVPKTCNKCHGNAEYMKEYKIPTDQFDKYKSSVHGIALLEKGDKNAPSCNKCHGDHGAAPPEIESISKVCGTCHVLNAQMFQESAHKQAFDNKGLHECGVCHNNHDVRQPSDDMIGTGEKSVCIKCHQAGDKGFDAAFIMKKMIDSLNNDVNTANYFINEAEQKGMDVSDSKFDNNDIKKVLITSRTVIHYANLQKYLETIGEGFKITDKAKQSGKESIDDYYNRRIYLGISSLFITIIGLALYMKLRKIQKKKV